MQGKDKVSVLGLGAMGSRFAARLLDAGYELSVYNRSEAPAAALEAKGARRWPTPREAVAGCRIVLGCVRDDDAARAIWLDEEAGALAGMAAGSVAIESSTLTPACVRAIGAEAAAREVALLDAPVVGSRPQAEAGQLAFLVGGDREALERARPVVDVLAGAVHHVGELGTGAALKLAVNALFGVQVTALAELLAFAARSGIEPGRAMEILGALPVSSPAAKGAGSLMLAGRHEPLFPIDLVVKDLDYAKAAAEAAGTDVPTTATAQELFARAQAAGHGPLNITGVAKLFE